MSSAKLGDEEVSAAVEATAPVSESVGDPDASDTSAEDTADDDDSELMDQLGIPMRREPTLDDVRSDGNDHRQLAFGCSLLVSLAVLAFWLVRGMLLSE